MSVIRRVGDDLSMTFNCMFHGNLGASQVILVLNNLSANQEMQEMRVQFLGSVLEQGMATHYSIFAWKIPRTEEPGRLQYMKLLSRIQLSDFHFHGNQSKPTVSQYLIYIYI